MMLVAASPTALASAAVRPSVSFHMSVTGEIRQLGPQKIVIGHVVCAIPPKLSLSAGRFVIGDPVRLICIGGKLKSVKYTPEVAATQTSKQGGPITPAAPTTRSACGLACPKSVSS